MTLPGETEAGSAGMQPCRGITWWAHRDDDRSAEPSRPRSSNNHIGSVDPDALKIPAPKGRNTNQQWDASPPFHAEPEQREQALSHSLPPFIFDAANVESYVFRFSPSADMLPTALICFVRNQFARI